MQGSNAPDKQQRDLRDFITFRLTRTQARLNAQGAKLLRAHSDLTIVQWRVISLLADAGGSTAAAMSQGVGFDKGQLSRALKQLQYLELTTHTTKPGDQRQMIVTLTPKGVALHARTLPAMQARQSLLESHLDHNDKARLFDILDKLDRAATDNAAYAEEDHG